MVKHALTHRTTMRQAVLELGFVERGQISPDELDRLLDVERLTRPPS